MLLIDATNLSAGGGGALLKYLVSEINFPFHLVVSHRVGLSESENIQCVGRTNPLGKKRQQILEQLVSRLRPDKALYFGNLPPRKTLDVKNTYTYFHNAHLIQSMDQRCRYSIKDRLRYTMIRRGIRKCLTNTQQWIFQTPEIRKAFVAEYAFAESNTHVLPFFDEQQLRQRCSSFDATQKRDGFIYLSDDRPHKNHRRLLDAWEILQQQFELTPTLHLTIPRSNAALEYRIKQLNDSGCNIINHGLMERDDALNLVVQCEFSIFPSLLETLGLGLIEGALLRTKVLCSNDKSLQYVIMPSASFDPLNTVDIAETVKNAIQNCDYAEIKLDNQIDDLLRLLAPQ